MNQTEQKPRETSRAVLYLLLVLVMLFWGGTWPAGRIISEKLNPWNSAFLRFAMATIPMVILCCWKGGLRGLTIKPSHLSRLIILGLTGILGYSAFFFTGLQTTTAARGAMIVGSIPGCVALASMLIFKERLRWYASVGIPLAFFGVLVVLFDGSFEQLLIAEIRRGDVYILGCVCCWTIYTLVGKPLLQEIPPLIVLTWAAIIGTSLMLPISLSRGLMDQIKSLDVVAWSVLLYLAIPGTLLAYMGYYYVLQIVGPVSTSIFINLVPVFGVFFGGVILKEPLSLSLLIGGGLVLSGVLITLKAKK